MEDRHLAVMIAQSCRHYGDRVAMRSKSGQTWQAITYRELGQRIQQIAAALVRMGVQAGDRVGIFSQNRAEWAIADFGILSIDAVTVPIYATNTASQTAYIVRDAGLQVLFVGDAAQYDKVRALADQEGLLRHIILFDPPAPKPETGRTLVPLQAFWNRRCPPASLSPWHQTVLSIRPGIWPASSIPPAPPAIPRA